MKQKPSRFKDALDTFPGRSGVACECRALFSVWTRDTSPDYRSGAEVQPSKHGFPVTVHLDRVRTMTSLDLSRQPAVSPPQAVRLLGRLPQLNRAILATSRIQLAVRRERDRPYRTVMTLASLCTPPMISRISHRGTRKARRTDFRAKIIIPHMRPRITTPASDESLANPADRHARHLALHAQLLDQRARPRGVEEVHLLARRHADGPLAHAVNRHIRSVQLTRPDRPVDSVRGNGRRRPSQVEPA